MNKKLLKKIFLVFIPIFLSINFVFAQNDVYKNVSSGLDNASTTTISNTSTGGLADTARYIGLMAAAAIVTLVIFKLIEGAVLKGTYDNIYDQQKGNKIIQNAVISFLIFIFVNLLFSYINPDYGSWIFNSSTGVTPGVTVSGGSCVVDQAYNNKSVEDEIKQDEEDSKYKPWVYMDSTGHPTIGWGFNLAQSGASSFMQKAGVDNITISSLLSSSCKNVSIKDSATSADKSCATTITQAQADAIFNTELATQKDNINKWVGGADKYAALPVNIQKALLNIMYNVGSDSMSKFTKMKSAVDTKDWKGVASELQNSTYCSQVGQRCSRLVGLILGECPTISSVNSSSLASTATANLDKFKNSNTPCPTNTTDIGTIKTNFQGNPTIRLCRLSSITGAGEDTKGNKNSLGAVVNAVVAADFQKMGEVAKNSNPSVQMSANSSFRLEDSCGGAGNGSACAKPGTSPHQLGIAVDFNNAGGSGDKASSGSSCSARAKADTPVYNWLYKYSQSYNIKQYSVEPWHWDEYPAGNRC